jgi:hypothetical protein
MAKYAFRAANYPTTTSIVDLGFAAYNVTGLQIPTVQSLGGVLAFKNNTNAAQKNAGFFSTDIPDTADFEILLLSKLPFSAIGGNRALIGGAGRFTGSSFYGLAYNYKNDASPAITKIQAVGTGTAFNSVTTNTTITAVNNTALGFAMRISVAGSTIRGRFWTALPENLQSSEPGTWDFVATDSVLSDPGKVGIFWREDFTTGALMFTDIGIGTGVDSAPYPDPDQVVTTPTGLTVSNVTTDSADVDWT